jgi:carboxypeptidase C (cathepsin A)
MTWRILCWITVVLAAPICASAAAVEPARPFISHHQGTFGGSALKYTVTAGDLVVNDASGAPLATFFTVSYTQDSARPSRPVTFLWNGGPGSSSLWLHMGAFGPRRVDLPANAVPAGVPPYPLVDNASSLLDVTDLVFVDPVGAGYSRPAGQHQAQEFYNIIADGDTFTSFIRAWLDTNGRNNSPKFVLGESYGSVRAGVVVRALSGGNPSTITLNGLILLGQDMDTTETQQTPGNDMPYVIYLPTYAAAAWWHGKVSHEGRTLTTFLQEARDCARTELGPALFLGSAISPAERSKVAAHMAALIGLPQALIERENLRIGTAQFVRELLRAEGRVLIRSDMRYTVAAMAAVFDQGGAAEPPGVPEAIAAGGAQYFRKELGIDMPMPYSVAPEPKWDYTLPEGNQQQTYHNVTPYVATAMRANPAMRLFLGSGIYDGLAAIHSAERTASHGGLPLERVVVEHYPAGHMIFLEKAALESLANDLRTFIRAGSTP